MTWNWQKKDWGNFTYDSSALDEFEQQFIHESGVMFGAFFSLKDEEQDRVRIEAISEEALKTSEIEGEYLNRDSLQSSICRQLGIKTDNRKIKPAEKGISELMIDLYKTYDEKLSHTLLFRWYGILVRNREDLENIGEYRKSREPMQIISGPIGDPRIHFEAPPFTQLHKEMQHYIKWFNQSRSNTLRPLARAGIAHLYFECIHPFEDGNGRIGRALTEKCLAQSLGKPTLIALSTIINADKKSYYDALEKANKSNKITPWLVYFSQTILESMSHSKNKIEALITKAKLFSKLDSQLNERQIKVLNKMFDAEPKGFEGGMSAAKYMSITGATIPTTTRDLADLVKKKALRKEGELKHSRYYLFGSKNPR